MSFAQARNTFENVQARYAKFGATDTEPRGVFRELIEQVHGGEEPTVPHTVRGWQLFSDMEGNQAAAEALGDAATAAVEAAKTDAIGLGQYMDGAF